MSKIDISIKNDSLDEDEGVLEEGLIQVVKTTKNTYYINIDDDIGEACDYRKICKILREAKEIDEVILVINSAGGFVNTGIQLHNYLLDTKAKTKAEVYMAYSAASVLMLSCDEIEMKDFSSVMVHSIAMGVVGKIDEIKEHTNFIEKLNKDINTKLYDTFLNDNEMEKIMSNKDYWFTCDEVKRRLKNWVPIRQRDTISKKIKSKKKK